LKFVPAEALSPPPPQANALKTEKAIFAGGCFWGVEYHFRRTKGVIATRVGYVGGSKDNPTYEQVCRGGTGHLEAVEVTYDPAQTTYETLARLFFEIHDPTQVDRQGPDVGEQYRSAIFYLSDQQKSTAEKLIGILREKGYDVVTQVLPVGIFWPAEDYHQQYYDKKGSTPYCHVYTKRF
jgi:peptide methionine sulfoxide reductase msrA/msrB